jgi:uncharacterized phage infection (PIP) family protein YhgE
VSAAKARVMWQLAQKAANRAKQYVDEGVAAGQAWAVAHPITTWVGATTANITGATSYLKQQQDDVLAARDGMKDFVNQQKADAISAAQDGAGDIASGIDKYSSGIVGDTFGVDVPTFDHAGVAKAAKDRLSAELDKRVKGKNGSTLPGVGGDLMDAAAVAKAKNAKLTDLEKKSLSNLPDRVIVRRLKDRERQAKYRLTHKRLMGKWVAK